MVVLGPDGCSIIRAILVHPHPNSCSAGDLVLSPAWHITALAGTPGEVDSRSDREAWHARLALTSRSAASASQAAIVQEVAFSPFQQLSRSSSPALSCTGSWGLCIFFFPACGVRSDLRYLSFSFSLHLSCFLSFAPTWDGIADIYNTWADLFAEGELFIGKKAC